MTKKGEKKFTHALDNIKPNKFDFLIAVILDENYNIIEVFKIPHDVVCQYLRKYKSGYSFRIEKAINEGKLDRYRVDIIKKEC